LPFCPSPFCPSQSSYHTKFYRHGIWQGTRTSSSFPNYKKEGGIAALITSPSTLRRIEGVKAKKFFYSISNEIYFSNWYVFLFSEFHDIREFH
jgi:hypothetical protein